MDQALPRIVSAQEWEVARQELLVAEKAHMKANDALAAKRRRMPMTPVTKQYRFESEDGERSLLELFDGERQLIVYRFFMDPDMEVYPEKGCPGCSMFSDNVAHPAHFRERDTRFVAVSRGEQDHLQRYKRTMGWEFDWYTTRDDFSADFDVPEYHGTNFFLRDGDDVYRTYFMDRRGNEIGSLWQLLDRTAYGRQEEWEDSPDGWPQTPPYTWGGWHHLYDHGV